MCERERLFGVDMLAGRERLEVQCRVGVWRGQVEHDLDLGVVQELLNRAGAWDVELLRPLLRQLGHQISDGDHIKDVKGLRAVLEVNTADHATAHYADFDLSHKGILLFVVGAWK